MTTPIIRCEFCAEELHKRTDGMLVCLEKTCPEFKKEIAPIKIISIPKPPEFKIEYHKYLSLTPYEKEMFELGFEEGRRAERNINQKDNV